ncbi:MAG: helix-turn-helix domain-containing protein [Candidatus Eremiobacteraeota bacterium]|nr:helix-turn-helix domain-containing protein [Candidatus Eremiobacteraeota bacterium]
MTAIDIAYRDLLIEELPRAIHSNREHRKYLARIEALLDQKKRSAAEDRLLELLSVLVERYEDEHETIEAPEPIAALKELMLAKGVSQAELSELLGSSGIASEVLSGKRTLSKAHIRKLCEAFHVPADIFV